MTGQGNGGLDAKWVKIPLKSQSNQHLGPGKEGRETSPEVCKEEPFGDIKKMA